MPIIKKLSIPHGWVTKIDHKPVQLLSYIIALAQHIIYHLAASNCLAT